MTQMPSLLWYQYLAILREDAPELIDEYIEETAAFYQVTCDYIIEEFILD